MKGYRFFGALAIAFLVSTGFAFSFTKADVDIHGKGGLVATKGSRDHTGDCWNRPYGYHCSLLVGEHADLGFELPGSGRFPDRCSVYVKRAGTNIGGVSMDSRFDVTVYSRDRTRCVIHKINDHDFFVDVVK